MRALEDFAGDAIEVLSRLDDARLAMLCRVLAVTLIGRGLRPGRALLDCAESLDPPAPAEAPPAVAIFSTDCGLPPPV